MSRLHSPQQVQDMLNAGMRQIEIAKAMGVRKRTITAMVRRCNLHDPHPADLSRSVQVQRMLFAGMRQCEIAAALGLKSQTINGIVKRNNLQDSQSRLHSKYATWEWTAPEPAAPIVVQTPKPPRPVVVKTGVPYRMSLTPLSQYLAAGRQTSAS